jgi:hypothetical protein
MNAISAYGRSLYALLPEIYRQRDAHEPAADPNHLLRYLDSHGVLLDLVRGTLEQMYADHFPDIPDSGRSCQAWIVPYLADLVGAAPVSPFADGQRDEVANAIRWSKRKGTLAAVQEIVEQVALSEAEIQEGWQRIVVYARPDDTILPAVFYGQAPHPIDAVLADPDPTAPFTAINPQIAARHPGLRAATVDLRETSRAIQAAPSAMGAHATRFNNAPSNWPRDDNAPVQPAPAPTGWRQDQPHGAPCFPDSYEDVSQRIVDMRSTDLAGTPGPHHPKALVLYMPPPFGLCPPNSVTVSWPANPGDWNNHPYLERIEPSADNPGRLIIRNKTAASVLITSNFTIGPTGSMAVPAGVTLELEKLRFDGTLTLAAGAAALNRCAVREFAFASDTNVRSLRASSVLFSKISGGNADVELEFCTILDAVTAAAKLKASETIFPDGVSADSIACARYSRLPPAILDPDIVGLSPATNTGAAPLFVSKVFCTPGAGVLRPDANAALIGGAEDGTEMGAYHDWRYNALRTAILRKLIDYLPLGVQPVIVWDPRLLATPPALTTS